MVSRIFSVPTSFANYLVSPRNRFFLVKSRLTFLRRTYVVNNSRICRHFRAMGNFESGGSATAPAMLLTRGEAVDRH